MAKKDTKNTESGLQPRPPIITVMGHVDHGKTSLLDFIRKTRVVAKEKGGITQHIGTYQVEVEVDKKKRKLTFIDTPGHAAFAEMRSRGGKVADLVVLVISATEGIKPQTDESIKHIRSAKVPFVVALNKMDLPTANPQKVKNELMEREIIPEDMGGDVPVVNISALKGDGVPELLETLALMADVYEITGDASAPLRGLIIESELDARKGPVATVVIKQGSIKVRDEIYAGKVEGKVKALLNEYGKMVQVVNPGDGIQIMGFNDVPKVGAIVTNEREEAGTGNVRAELKKKDGSLPLVVKADVGGSLEAILASLPGDVRVIESGVGEITEKDVNMAKVGSAQVIGFNVTAPETAKRLAEEEKVKISSFGIIYELLQYTEEEIRRLTDPFYGREITGKAEVLADFMIDKRKVLGGKVAQGELRQGDTVFIIRSERVIGTSRIANLQVGKNKTEKVSTNNEFGLILSPYVDFQKGDEVVAVST